MLYLRSFCLTALFALLALSASAQETVVDEIAAVVGDQIILRSDVDALAMSFVQQSQGQVAFSESLWKDALEQLVGQKVLAIHAERDTTIQVTDDQLAQALDRRIQQMAAQVGSESRLEEVYGKSVVEIKADFREEFRSQLLAEQFQGRRMAGLDITPSEVRTWFDAIPQDSLPVLPEVVRLAHIVRYPEVTEAARAEARSILGAIRDSVVAGSQTLEAMAQQFSDDPGSAANGGRYQGMRVGEFAPEFAAVAARIPEREISQIFETQFGLHILRVNERRGDVLDLNHILIRFDERKFDSGEARELLAAVRDSALVHEVPFEALARRHSEEEATARRGGRVVDPRSGERDLYVQALNPSWRTTIARLRVGEISPPTEADLLDGKRAWHVVKLQKRTPEHRVDFVTDYELIRNYALQEKRARVIEAWIAGLKKDVYIDIRVDSPSGTYARR